MLSKQWRFVRVVCLLVKGQSKVTPPSIINPSELPSLVVEQVVFARLSADAALRLFEDGRRPGNVGKPAFTSPG